MSEPNETKPGEPRPDEYARFIRLLSGILAVLKSAIYKLDPRLRPKPRPVSGYKKEEK